MKALDHRIRDLQKELDRLAAPQIKIELDAKFEPKTGPLLKVRYDGADWHMIPQDFRNLLAELPDRCGPAHVKAAIESKVSPLWHGPAPKGSRDTQH